MSIDQRLLAARSEFYDLASTTPEYLRYVRHHGFDVARISDFAGATAILPIIDCGNGRFDWDALGDTFPGFICEAYAEDGEMVLDLIAWPLSRPGHVLSMFGRAPLLGLWEALNPATYYLDKALVMHRTPLDWLKAECRGAAVVSPRLAARLFLDLQGPVAARDRAHARELLALSRSVVNPDRVVVATNAGHELVHPKPARAAA